MGNLLKKHDLLIMLEKQSVDWITDTNADINVNKNLERLIPPTIMSHVDYYQRLHDRAMLVETGNSDKAEENREKVEIIKYKNGILRDIFTTIKTSIRHVSYTPEHSIYSIYLDYITRLKNNLVSLLYN